VTTASTAARADRLVELLRERRDIGPADIKDLLGISRKYAIPLLEHFDTRGVTRRVGERRVLRGSTAAE
jgi:selenocysteine-specific elongation factor